MQRRRVGHGEPVDVVGLLVWFCVLAFVVAVWVVVGLAAAGALGATRPRCTAGISATSYPPARPASVEWLPKGCRP